MNGSGINRIMLPLSDLQIQWRAADEHLWVGPGGESPTTNGDRESGWQAWTGSDVVNAAYGTINGSRGIAWWMAWGELRGEPVDILLEGTVPARVKTIGKVWAAEWSGLYRNARLHTNQAVVEIAFHA
ncbi:hypothetical protein ACFROC_01060 [Nocardia tengchongensis]|uniref:hypothetical protein n=1 Tax=Nocardia tengchongensis TaxID=2055889 RepID=UPI003676E8F9